MHQVLKIHSDDGRVDNFGVLRAGWREPQTMRCTPKGNNVAHGQTEGAGLLLQDRRDLSGGGAWWKGPDILAIH